MNVGMIKLLSFLLTFFSYLVLREGILQTAASLIPYFVKNKLLSRNALQQQLLFQQTLFL